MRMLLKAEMPTADGNRAIKDGSLAAIVRKTLETIHAECAYFTSVNGHRTMIAVFDLKSSSDIPRIAEPLFMGLNAKVEFLPCMNAEELKLGLSALE